MLSLLLSLVEYDEDDLLASRDKCLGWQDRFVNHSDQRKYTEYLLEAPLAAEADGLFERPAKKLSK